MLFLYFILTRNKERFIICFSNQDQDLVLLVLQDVWTAHEACEIVSVGGDGIQS